VDGPGIQDVREAAARIAGRAHRTPVVTCATIDRLAGRSLFFKCENLQKGGAFKFRGALNAVSSIPEERARRGVAAHSSGNHAQAVALAAGLRGIPAHIVMPENAPDVKRRSVVGYGARLVDCPPTVPAREEAARKLVEETGAAFVHPYDDPHVIAGQGTVALELLEQVPDLDAVVAPVGGGGLLAGICIAVRGTAPGVRLFGAEPAGADDAARSLAAGRRLLQTDPRTIADGLLTSLGERNWPILRDALEAIPTVGDDEIVAAMRLLFERAKQVVEPSGAVALAAVLAEDFRRRPGLARVGVVLSGGNADLDALPW
jgi:threonine dehydratase